MQKTLVGLLAPAVMLAGALPFSLAAQVPAASLTPADIVSQAPASAWVRIAPSDLMVMDLAPDSAGKPRRVVIQLLPAPYSQGWVDNIRKLVAAHWYDGIAVVRVQDNYVVQWGDPDGENPGKAKPLPTGLQVMPSSAYTSPLSSSQMRNDAQEDRFRRHGPYTAGPVFLDTDAYAKRVTFKNGWPIALGDGEKWPIHCYGMVGVGRNLSPDTGTGAELYTVIGQAPRQLDRNIALVGRIIEGMANLSSLPRGTGEMGFYKTPSERTPILSVRMGNDVSDLPAYEYLATDSASFAAYVHSRANRQDSFYFQPAGGVDACNVPVPIREVK